MATSSLVRLRATALLSLVAFVVAGFGPQRARADEHPPLADPVHARLDACLVHRQNGSTTLELRECYLTAERAYERRLAETFTGVLGHVDGRTRAEVRASQAAWIAYRKRVQMAQRAPWAERRGVLVSIDLDEANLAAVRARLLELRMIWPGFSRDTGDL